MAGSKYFGKRAKKNKEEKRSDAPTEELLGLVAKEESAEEIPAALTEVVQEAIAEAEVAVTMSPHYAQNIYYDTKRRKYILVTIMYYPDGDDFAKIVKTEDIADNMAVAMKKMNDKLALKLMRHEEDV
jgi:hypothetical protein